MHSHGSFFWRGKLKRVSSVRARLVGPQHEVVAVGVGGEVAVGDLGHEQVLGLGLVELLAQLGADALFELGVGLGHARRLVTLQGRKPHWLRNSAVRLR